MASSADDILTVAEFKQELTLPPTHISEDARFARLIRQAIDQVAADTGLPLIDESPVTVFADVPNSDDPLVIYEQNFTFDKEDTSHEIDYWNKADLGDAPDASISRAEIGRTIRSDDGRTYFIYLADGNSWPDNIRPETRIRIKGSTTYAVPEGLKAAVVVLARFLYSGDQMWPGNPAYNKLINPFRRLTPST